MDFLLIAFLTLLNGVFAMSEMALASSRKARLSAMAQSGDKGAQAALGLLENPTQFLSSVQVGITSIGMLNGIIGEAAFSDDLMLWLAALGMPERPASITATALVVTIITFITIVFGELVPKRIGQLYPETVSRLVSRPMAWVARVAKPFVRLLSLSTQRVQNVFRLDDRPLTSLMVPRSDVHWLDAACSVAQALQQAGAGSSTGAHSWYPVCRGSLDEVVGVISVARLLELGPQEPLPVGAHAQAAAFLPETLSGMELLEQFRQRAGRMVFVVDEYGVVQGLMTPRDLLEAITGELQPGTPRDAWAVQREDGSWLLDGLVPVPELKARLDIRELPDEDRGRYNTLAGLLLAESGHLPSVGERIACVGWIFEVVDLDGKRI